MADTKGLWVEKFDEEGNSSLGTLTPRTVWTSCKPDEHYFELTENRVCECSKCGIIQKIILGIQILQDGKIIQLR